MKGMTVAAKKTTKNTMKTATGRRDATMPLCEAAAALPDVVEGASCTQRSFKVGKNAFLYIGPQAGGKPGYKAMFKLDASKEQAADLAKADPDAFGVGSTSWVTAKFTDDKPLAKAIWNKWLRESYALSAGSPAKKKAAKKMAKKVTKKTAKKMAKKTVKKKPAT